MYRRGIGVKCKGGEGKGREMEEEGLEFSSLNVKVKLQLIYNIICLS